MRSEVGTTLLS